MKLLSKPDGDALLTNAEVMHWLRELKLDAPRDVTRPADANTHILPPTNLRAIGKELLQYFARTPSANQTVASVNELFNKLRKYELTDPELLMIANIRPEAYAHISPLVIDIHRRFDDDTIYEILEIVNSTLEPRPNSGSAESAENDQNELVQEHEGEEENIELMTKDEMVAIAHQQVAELPIDEKPTLQ